MSDESEATPPDLETATHDQLVAELAKRNDGLVVLCVRYSGKFSDDQEEFEIIYRGGFTLCMGLISRGRARFDHLANPLSRSSENDE